MQCIGSKAQEGVKVHNVAELAKVKYKLARQDRVSDSVAYLDEMS